MVTWIIVGFIAGFIIGVWLIHYLDEKDRKEFIDLLPVVKDSDIRGIAIDIGNSFEEYLTDHDVRVPNDDREGDLDEAAIYGDDWTYIVQRNEFWVRRLLWISGCSSETDFEKWMEVTEPYDRNDRN